MSIQRSYMRFRTAARRFGGGALAFAGVLAAAGCASSGSAAGTYHPGSMASIGAGASWAGEPSGVHINVDLSERKLYLKNGNEVVQAYSIGVGKPGFETPVGDYSVRKIVWNPPWNPPDEAWAEDKEPQPPGAADNPMKVVKIYFKEPDYYIHGTGTVSTLGRRGVTRLPSHGAERCGGTCPLFDGARWRVAQRSLVPTRRDLERD